MRHCYMSRWVLVTGMTSALTAFSSIPQLAHAGTTSSSTVVYACLSYSSLRIVPASEPCRSTEKRMTISGLSGSTGTQGPAGPAGPQGPAGPTGATGATGPQGPHGEPGAPGAAGADGQRGEAGTTGQSAKTFVSVGSRVLSVLDGGPYEVPGLGGVITTTQNSAVVLSTEGLIVSEDSVVGDNVRVTIRLLLDGAVVAQRRYDVERGNFTNSTRWSFTTSRELAPGEHTVSVEAMLVNVGRMADSNPFPAAIIGGPAASWAQSTLTAVVLNK